MALSSKTKIGELLLAEGVFDQTRLTRLLEVQKKTGRKLGRLIVEAGILSEEALAKVLAKQLSMPYFNLQQANLTNEAVGILSETQARRLRALVVENGVDRLRVAVSDPTDLGIYDGLSRALPKAFELVVVAENELLATFDRVYRRKQEIEDLAIALREDLSDVKHVGEFLSTVAAQENAPVAKLLQTVFEEAIKMRASDIHMEPQAEFLRIRFRVDGVLYMQTEADKKITSAITLRLKLISGLDIAERRLPQDGRFNFEAQGKTVDVRISTMPTQYGESVVMRLLNQSAGMLSLERLGMRPTVLATVREAIHRSSGMVLVTGPTGSGKTTTLYAALSELNNQSSKIITVEDPIEYRLPDINQVQVNEKISLGFERVLRSALRQDPDILMVGEIRDHITAEIGMRAAMTGHVVLSTLHTNDALTTPMRLIDMGVPRYMVAISVNLVLAQRLVRCVCEQCAKPIKPTDAQAAWIARENVDKKEFRQGAGCMRCNQTGYIGRTGVYETLSMTRPLVEALNAEDANGFAKAARMQLGENTLGHDAALLAAEGVTTVEEAMRVASAIEA